MNIEEFKSAYFLLEKAQEMLGNSFKMKIAMKLDNSLQNTMQPAQCKTSTKPQFLLPGTTFLTETGML